EHDLNRRLAELLGYKIIRIDDAQSTWFRAELDGKRIPLPSYVTDLNAVHGVVMGLTDEQRHAYRTALIPREREHRGSQIDATALQRTEALIKALEQP